MNHTIRKLYNVLVVGGALAAAAGCDKPAGKARTPTTVTESEAVTEPVPVADSEPEPVTESVADPVADPVAETDSAAMAPTAAPPVAKSRAKKKAPPPAPAIDPTATGVRGWH